MKNAVTTTKRFVARHKVLIAVSVTVLVTYKIHTLAMKEQLGFIKEKGLLDEYFHLKD